MLAYASNLLSCCSLLPSINLLLYLELVSKKLNHLVAILHVYAGVWFLWSKEKILFSKRKGMWFYTFNDFYSKKSLRRAN